MVIQSDRRIRERLKKGMIVPCSEKQVGQCFVAYHTGRHKKQPGIVLPTF